MAVAYNHRSSWGKHCPFISKLPVQMSAGTNPTRWHKVWNDPNARIRMPSEVCKSLFVMKCVVYHFSDTDVIDDKVL